MPHESRLLMRDNETLLDICIETHMSHTGSSDPLREEDLQRNILVLRTAVDNWKDESVRTKRFDDAVLELCRAVLAEVSDVDGASCPSRCSSSLLIKSEIHKAKSGRYDALWDDDRTEGYIAGLERALEVLEPEWESLPESTGGFFIDWNNNEPPQLWVWRGEPGDETAEAWQKVVY